MTASHTEKTKAKRRAYNREYDIKHKDWISRKRKAVRDADPERKNKANALANTICGRASRMFHSAKRRGSEKNLPFDIVLQDVKDALKVGICQRTGIRFYVGSGSSPYSPSIDRKDSNQGYTKDNVQYVCCAYNLGKQHMSDSDFENFILQAAEFIKIMKFAK